MDRTQARRGTAPSLKGIGGWLLLFFLGVTIVTPLVCLVEISQNPSDPIVIVFDLGLAGFSIFTGIATWRVFGQMP